MQRQCYKQGRGVELQKLSEAGEHVPTELPNDRTHVSYLLDSLKMDNPKMLAGTAAIEQDELGKRVHFEKMVTFLLPFDPVVAKDAKAKGIAGRECVGNCCGEASKWCYHRQDWRGTTLALAPEIQQADERSEV